MTTNRTAFEEWAEEKGFLLARERNGSYARPVTQAIYLAWQAATSLARNEGLEMAARAIENEPAVNALPFAAAIRALKDETK